ncbi:glycolate oxidase subunit GlcE [Hydrogenophaga sp.]|uniref:glycolate oxidase subunit GlcE n=1 Tax=Hydrogenophaga sp. TaxID=1904254 RepID=UPI0019878E73|nr:glycolate oxidase subunit GlcE [Hydrogenophaga sp.]MBD3894105.1 glycolate oxidase subunit GlcE [Hydrogenophaga sp.]
MIASSTDRPEPLIDQVRAAAASRSPLRIVGGNSKSFYGQATPGQVLDTRLWRGITSYEPSELVVTARAGTPLVELEALLATQGQYLPFDPPHYGPDSTVGGMVAAGLSGPARASVGSVRDFVLGVQLINGSGEWLTFGGQVIKNVAGYDVSRLMVGSMGTLGVVTDVSLKVLPLPLAEATLVFSLPQHEALEQLHRWGAQPLPLNASCWVRDASQPDAPELLFVRLRGARAAVQWAVDRICREAGGGQRIDNAQAGADWAACADQRLPFFRPAQLESADQTDRSLCLWRLSVPATAPVLHLPGPLAAAPQMIEWHGAQRWLWASFSAAAELRAAAAAVGGHACLFRAGADGAADVPRWDRQSPTLAAIEQRLRACFDPFSIFNPGRMI